MIVEFAYKYGDEVQFGPDLDLITGMVVAVSKRWNCSHSYAVEYWKDDIQHEVWLKDYNLSYANTVPKGDDVDNNIVDKKGTP